MIRRVLVACLFGLISLTAAGVAVADWREDIGAFRIGILAHGDSRTAVAQAEPFRLAVEEKLGISVEIFAARDYAALIDAAASSRIEYAVMSATAYAIAWNRCECIEPLAIARSGDGTDAIHEVVVTRQDGPASLSGLKGRRLAATAAQAFGGLDIAMRQMRREGFDPSDEATLARHSTGERAITALREGEADALIGWSTMTGDPAEGYSQGSLRRLGELEGDTTGYRIVWQSVAIPNRVHAARRNLPGEARTRLRELLSSLFDADPVAYDAIEPVYGGGFVPARQGQFSPLAELLGRPDSDAGGAGAADDANDVGETGAIAPAPQDGNAAAAGDAQGANEEAPDTGASEQSDNGGTTAGNGG